MPQVGGSFFRRVQQVESVDLMTLPSVVARMGEQSTIEQIREVIYPGDDGEFVTDWTGIRVSSTPEGHGFGFRQTSHFESRELVGDGENLSAASFSSNEIQIGDIAPNRFTLSANQEIEGNRELSFLSVPQLIDASGQAILAGPEQ